jgi:outer membrane receptor protein involved in Fe transport
VTGLLASRVLLLACGLWPAAFGLSSPLSGTVRDGFGFAIPGVRVTVHQRTGDQTTVTGQDGTYAFADVRLPAQVEVELVGFDLVGRVVTTSPADFTIFPSRAYIFDSVIVTADRTAAWRDATTGATVLSAADVQAVPSETLDETLRVISGFSLFRRSSSRYSNPTTHGVTMRGLSASGASRGLILLDGVPLNDGFGGWVTWTRLPSMAIDRVDVERGAEGDVYGSDALGGVVRIVTPSNVRPNVSFEGQGGSLGFRSADLSAGERYHRWSFFGAGSWVQLDGAIPVVPEARGAIDRPASAKWANGLGRVDLAGKSRHLTGTFWGGRDTRNNGTLVQVNRMNGNTASASFDAIGAGTTFAARVSTSPNKFYQTFSSVNPPAASRAGETLTSTQRIDATTTRAIVEVGHRIPRGLARVTASMTRAHSTFQDLPTAVPAPISLRDDGEAVAAQVAISPVSLFTLNAGVRQEWRAAPTTDDARDTATVGHLSGVLRLSDSISIRSSAATSHRWPTLNELVRNFQAGNTLTKANPNLNPERAVSFDVQLAVTGRRWLVSAAAFRTVVDGAIANVTQSTTPSITRQRQNTGEAHATGGEFDVELKPIDRVRVRASATLIDAHFRNSLEAALEGKLLPQVPKQSWSVSADLHLPYRVDASLLAHGVSTQFDDDRNVFLLQRATSADARIAGRVSHVGWQFVIENLTNARLETGRSSATLVTIAPPRAYRFGVTIGSQR